MDLPIFLFQMLYSLLKDSIFSAIKDNKIFVQKVKCIQLRALLLFIKSNLTMVLQYGHADANAAPCHIDRTINQFDKQAQIDHNRTLTFFPNYVIISTSSQAICTKTLSHHHHNHIYTLHKSTIYNPHHYMTKYHPHPTGL